MKRKNLHLLDIHLILLRARFSGIIILDTLAWQQACLHAKFGIATIHDFGKSKRCAGINCAEVIILRIYDPDAIILAWKPF